LHWWICALINMQYNLSLLSCFPWSWRTGIIWSASRIAVKSAHPGMWWIKVAVGAAKGVGVSAWEGATTYHFSLILNPAMTFDDYVAKISEFNLWNHAPNMVAHLHSTCSWYLWIPCTWVSCMHFQ
jgi:hypothetical protein